MGSKVKRGSKRADSEDDEDDDEEEEEEEEEEGDEEEEEEDDNEEGAQKKEGMADMMSRILDQSVSASNPVLAKRKTAIMKQMEESKDDRNRLKRARADRKSDREKQLALPDATTADYENQLRKLATRGVIALFNAISTSKREEADARSADAAKNADETKQIFRLDVKQMTQANFRELLKGEDSIPPKVTLPKSGILASSGAAVESSKGKSWSALRDNYLLESSMTLKDWDKESDKSDDGGDNLELDEGQIKKGKAH